MSFLKNILKIKNLPSFSQWRYFFKILNKKEKIVFFSLLVLFVLSLSFFSITFYFKNTNIQPKKGGIYVEGVIGQPRFINPIYAVSDVDRDLVELTFSGLMKYDKNLEIIPDLVKNYKIEEEGKVYKLYLKENIFWQDKTPITADDIIFTVKTIQNPDYKSPIRGNWIGVEVEKISESAVKFSISQPYSSFIENLTLKIIPKHIFNGIAPENMPFEIYNLKPISSGPYKIKDIEKDKKNKITSIILTPNPFYYGKEPYLSKIKFSFFNNEEEIIKAAKKGKITGFSLNNYKDLGKKWNVNYLELPRYFSLFLNQVKSKPLAEKEVRIALNYATNKKEIVEMVLNNIKNSINIETKIVNSPILSQMYGFKEPSFTYDFNLEKAKEILEKIGYKENNGIREKVIKKEPSFQFKTTIKYGSKGKDVEELQRCLSKFPEIYPEKEINGNFGKKTEQAVIKFQERYAEDILKPKNLKKGNGIVDKQTINKLNEICFEESIENIPLKFSILTVDQSQMIEIAKIIKNQWEQIGIKSEIESLPISDIEQKIKSRDYDILLFGEILGAIPDLFPFWHSSQKKEPGLNLSLYENKEADKLLEEIRKSNDKNYRAEKLDVFQNIIIKDAPAIFIYSPDFIYFTSKQIKGFDRKKIVIPSMRFLDIENWYIKTKRIFK